MAGLALIGTRNFVTHNSCHTHLCHTHHLSHTTLSHHLSHTHTLSHTIFHTQLSHSHTSLCHTQLCHTPSFTHNFVTHNFVTHTLCHTPSLSHTQLCHTPSCHTHLCHTPSFTHTQLCHTSLSHTPSLSHTSHTSLSHTIFHTQLCHTPSFTHIFVTHHLSHTSWLHTIFATHPLPHTHTTFPHATLSHTIFHTQPLHIQPFHSSIIHHLPCLSCLPRPAATLCSDYWKKLTCGVIRSFNFGEMEKQRWEESGRRSQEVRRSEKRKSEKQEDPGARKGRKVTIHCIFPMIWGSGWSKSNLAKAAGAEPAGQMGDKKLHAVVARSTFPSQKANITSCSDHFWKLRCRKSARRCGAKRISKAKVSKTLGLRPLLEVEMSKKCTPLWREARFQVKSVKELRVLSLFGRSDVEKVHTD